MAVFSRQLHLPTEIWTQILSSIEETRLSIWLRCRLVSHQLKVAAEDVLKRQLRDLVVGIAIRVPVRGLKTPIPLFRRAEFHRLEGDKVVLRYPAGLEDDLKYNRGFFQAWTAARKGTELWYVARRALRQIWEGSCSEAMVAQGGECTVSCGRVGMSMALPGGKVDFNNSTISFLWKPVLCKVLVFERRLYIEHNDRQ